MQVHAALVGNHPLAALRRHGTGLLLAAGLGLTAWAPDPAAAQAEDGAAARFARAMALAERQDDAQAMAIFEAIAREHPDRPEPRINLGVLLTRAGRLAEARVQFEEALRTSAPHALAHDNLTRLHVNLARRAYAAALGTGARPPAAQDGLALSPWPDGLATPPPPPAPPPQPSPASAPAGPDAPATAPVPPPPAASLATDLPMKHDLAAYLRPLVAALVLLALGATAWSVSRRGVPGAPPADAPPPATPAPPATPSPAPAPRPAPPREADGPPEERLIGIYRLIGRGDLDRALRAAEALVHDAPKFTLAQLVYGDLLLAQTGQIRGFGRGHAEVPGAAPPQAAALQQEARQRLRAWQEPPPAGTVPSQVLQIPASVRHVVAVDASRARLFVLEHRGGQLVHAAHHYVAIGKLGIGKRDEGDQRTPLGLYEITSRLSRQQVGEFYGAGALPLSYPNEHDRRLHRTGANIWLHGTAPARYADPPRSSNGCVVLANDDMARLLRDLVPHRTPVIIAERLEWVPPRALAQNRLVAQNLAELWRMARMKGEMGPLMQLYARRFDNGETGLAGWQARLAREMGATGGRDRQLADLSLMAWRDGEDVLMISFREVLRGSADGPLRRQYWVREQGQWKIFSEGVMQ